MVDEERIRSAIAPVVDGLGMTVVRVAWGRQGRSRRLRIDVDRKRDGPVPVPYPGSRMTADDLGGVTREISAVLDAYGVMSGTYVLEVSTPGLDRPLVTRQDFLDFIGHPVRLSLERLMDGRRRFLGTIVGIEGEGSGAEVVIREAGGDVRLAFSNIQTANLQVNIDGFGCSQAGKERQRKKRNAR